MAKELISLTQTLVSEVIIQFRENFVKGNFEMAGGLESYKLVSVLCLFWPRVSTGFSWVKNNALPKK